LEVVVQGDAAQAITIDGSPHFEYKHQARMKHNLRWNATGQFCPARIAS
jgi:hypothetical protein